MASVTGRKRRWCDTEKGALRSRYQAEEDLYYIMRRMDKNIFTPPVPLTDDRIPVPCSTKASKQKDINTRKTADLPTHFRGKRLIMTKKAISARGWKARGRAKRERLRKELQECEKEKESNISSVDQLRTTALRLMKEIRWMQSTIASRSYLAEVAVFPSNLDLFQCLKVVKPDSSDESAGTNCRMDSNDRQPEHLSASIQQRLKITQLESALLHLAKENEAYRLELPKVLQTLKTLSRNWKPLRHKVQTSELAALASSFRSCPPLPLFR